MKRLLASFLFLSFLNINPVLAETITVSGDVYGTWTADTVLVAGEVRVPVDSVLVIAPGVKVLFDVYCKFVVDFNATLLAAGTEADSILFDELNPGTGWHGIRFDWASDSSRLEYCQLKHGRASGIGFDNHGGGIYCYNSSPSLMNCLIDSCLAESHGGGIFCDLCGPILQGNIISNNTAFHGGGIWCANSNPTISENVIFGNAAEQGGGGIYASNSNPLISFNDIRGNNAEYVGGIHCINSNPTIHGNIISENSAVNNQCGAIYCDASNAVITENRIIGNSSDAMGGGIICLSSEVIIAGNIICDNSAATMGGGLYLYANDITISGNIIANNTTNSSCGGVYSSNCTSLISGNVICGNSAMDDAGGIRVGGPVHQMIVNNIITENTTDDCGGGIFCSNTWSTVDGNLISNNLARHGGGGIYAPYGNSTIINNAICGNSAGWRNHGGGIYLSGTGHTVASNMLLDNFAGYGGGICIVFVTSSFIIDNYITSNNAFNGGGIYSIAGNPTMTNNSVAVNSSQLGGGVYCFDSSVSFENFIIWDNASDQIFLDSTSSLDMTYSDVQDSIWPGIGNISEDPMFINLDLNDYRLQWGSPCIDAGDPDPQYNDPDSTRADMGAFYYDQSVPVRILLSPHEIPFLIEPEGGTMDYTIQATNIYQSSHDVTVWCDVELPDSSVYGPVLGPVTITIEPGETVERIRTQTVPALAPMGVYHYNAYAVVDQDTSKDSFMFGKLGTVAGGMDGWGNAGDPLEEIIMKGTACCAPTGFGLFGVYPHPFNAVTVLSYKLQVASRVNLSVYDVSGRKVAELVNGWREAGRHEVTFDGSDLASGIYIYRLTTDIYDVSRKMVLIK